jgi:hypothetical protein
MSRRNYGDDAEYDAWIEKQADPEWTGYDSDPSGSMADREQARWERRMSDRGRGTLAVLLAAAVYIASPILAIWAIYLHHTVIAAVLLYVTVAVSVALLLGHWMRRDDQDEWDQYVQEAIDLASMPLSERIAADMAPEMVREIEDHLREVGK